MAMDPALAGLLCALVGGGFTFAGSILGNTQQARHDREDCLEQRKVETYTNAMRSLLRATHYLELTPGGDLPPSEQMKVRGEQFTTRYENLVEAEYWLFVLAASCGSRHRKAIAAAAQKVLRTVDQSLASGFRRTDETVLLEDLWSSCCCCYPGHRVRGPIRRLDRPPRRASASAPLPSAARTDAAGTPAVCRSLAGRGTSLP